MAAGRHVVRVGSYGFGPRRLLGGVAAASLVTAVLLLGLLGRSLLRPTDGASLHRSSFSVPTDSSPSYGPSSSPPASPPPSSPRATRVCEARLAQYAGIDNPTHVSLVAAYAATSQDVAADDDRRHGDGPPSQWHDRPAGEFEAVCFFDADAFGVDPSPLPGRAGHVGFDRLEEIVRPDGVPVVYEASHKTEMSARPIPTSTGQS